MVASPLREATCTAIVGAGRKDDNRWSFVDAIKDVAVTARVSGLVLYGLVGGGRCWRSDLHTSPTFRQPTPRAGQIWRPPLWRLPPHRGHMVVDGVCLVLPDVFWQFGTVWMARR